MKLKFIKFVSVVILTWMAGAILADVVDNVGEIVKCIVAVALALIAQEIWRW